MLLEKGELSVGAVVAVVIACGTLVIGFYTQVVIPIKSIEAKMASIEITLNQHDSSEQEIKNKVYELEKTAVSNVNRIKYIEKFLKISN